MRTGEMLVGTGDNFTAGLTSAGDDLYRNRDRSIIPRFFMQPVKKADGNFMEVEYLELLIPGDSKSSPVHLVDQRLIDRYPTHYKAFKENREMPIDGTPIETWLGADDLRVHMLRSLHLRTVESVAGMSDAVMTTVGMGARELKERANRFLEVQENGRVSDELVAKDNVIEDLKKRLAKLENPNADPEEKPEGASHISSNVSKKVVKEGKKK